MDSGYGLIVGWNLKNAAIMRSFIVAAFRLFNNVKVQNSSAGILSLAFSKSSTVSSSQEKNSVTSITL